MFIRHTFLEIGNGLARLRSRGISIDLIKYIQEDSYVTLLEIDKNLYEKSFNLFSSRTDKEWGLVDCSSFVIMKERGINLALTADRHFQQAGFRALMLED